VFLYLQWRRDPIVTSVRFWAIVSTAFAAAAWFVFLAGVALPHFIATPAPGSDERFRQLLAALLAFGLGSSASAAAFRFATQRPFPRVLLFPACAGGVLSIGIFSVLAYLHAHH
jgi:hypothetical protein